MKFIDDICDKIVSPPKVRYSPYDLGTQPVTKVVSSVPTACVKIFTSLTTGVCDCMSASTKPITSSAKISVLSIYTA